MNLSKNNIMSSLVESGRAAEEGQPMVVID